MKKYQKGWQGFVELCQQTKDEKTLSHLFNLLLTPEEKENIAMRCLVIRELLLQQKTQREIARHLNVSIAKITRGSNELKRMKAPYVEYLKALLIK